MNKVMPWIILGLAILGGVYLWKMYGQKAGGDGPGASTST